LTFAQALAYFTREAVSNVLRGWKVSLLAILTITVSLFLAGVFVLVSGNLGQVIEQWQGESKMVVYLENGASDEEVAALAERLRRFPGARGVEQVSAERAEERFRETFPSLAGLLEGWGEQPLPASLEVLLAWDQLDAGALEALLAQLRSDPAVAMVDDDRDWIRQLEAVVTVLRALGLVLGGVLLATAVFTISSVIRLTAFLYRDEIAVMRLVGATEFFIRGPFYVEGLLQGLIGSALAMLALLAGHGLVLTRQGPSLLASLLAARFLDGPEIAGLVLLGAGAGLLGAIASLRREELGSGADLPTWTVE